MENKADNDELAEQHTLHTRISKRGGFTLAEVAMASAVLTIAAGGLMSSIIASMALNRVNNETALAQTYARRAVERLQSVDFASTFASFNANAADDPTGPGTAPGANFDAFGLDPLATDVDGRPGEIIFPTVTIGATQQLREDVNDPALGMPRDLNGDGLPPDAVDHAGDYRVLPVRVRVQWRGATGPRSIVVETLLTAR
ncbi:MAG: hypothetical protein SGI72_17605 [Planctomycetota bacterium]|nr:hypothetical protein [Planctomycetota bacterium]